MLDKEEMSTLRLFLTYKTPYDFDCGVYNLILIDSLMGLVHQTLNGKKLTKSYINKFKISDDNMVILQDLSNKNIENKIYFKLILDCFKIINKYAI